MSEQIRQLAEQAGIHGDSYLLYQHRLEQFAELLVVKCANFVENIFDDDGGHATCEDYAKGIKQYFGVEE